MGTFETKIEQESTVIDLKNNISFKKPVPLSLFKEFKKSICKIIIDEERVGTGFFRAVNSYQYLITCFHVVESELNYIIKIEIWNKNIFNIKLEMNTYQIYKDWDVILIDIKELNIKNIDFLYYDTNYIQFGYSQYENLNIFTLLYSFGIELAPKKVSFIKKRKIIYFFIILILKGILLVLLLYCLIKKSLEFIWVMIKKPN